MFQFIRKYNSLRETIVIFLSSQSKLYVSVDNKKHALDLECKFTDKSVMLKRDLWRGDKCYKMDISYQIKMIGKLIVSAFQTSLTNILAQYLFWFSLDVTNYEKNLLIHLDLKPHIPNGELFVIEGKTTRTLSNYDQKLSLLWAPEKKVEYIINSSPGKSGLDFWDFCNSYVNLLEEVLEKVELSL